MRSKLLGACLIVALGIAGALALSVVPGSRPTGATAIGPAGNTNPLYEAEIAVLTDQGISAEGAARQLELQSEVAEAELPAKLEAAMGGEYAGVWYEPEAALLHIGVASAAGRATAEAVVAKAGLGAGTVATRVDSTWAELSAAQMSWNRRLADLFASEEARTALSAERNAVVVSVGQLTSAAERSTLREQASSGKVNVQVNVSPSRHGRAGDVETECKEFKVDEAFCDKPITAGVTIKSENGKICTAGPVVISAAEETETYVLTAGHCIKNAGGVGKGWSAFWEKESPSKIGNSKEYSLSVKGDYGRIQVELGSYWTTKNGLEPAWGVMARWSKNEGHSYTVVGQQEPVEKATTCHEGQTTGEKCGEIKNTSVTEKIDGVKVEKLVEHTAESAPGDSGGPYFGVNKSGEIFVEGTHVAQGRFQKLSIALNEMGMVLLTEANQLRP